MAYGKNLKLTHLIAPGMEICNGCLKSSSKNFWNSDDLHSLSFWAPAFFFTVCHISLNYLLWDSLGLWSAYSVFFTHSSSFIWKSCCICLCALGHSIGNKLKSLACLTNKILVQTFLFHGRIFCGVLRCSVMTASCSYFFWVIYSHVFLVGFLTSVSIINNKYCTLTT